MLKNRIFIIAPASLLFSWLVLSIALGGYHEASDGFTEVGFPFTFYRGFSGKYFDCPETGILSKGLIADLGIVIVIAVLVALLIRERRRTTKTFLASAYGAVYQNLSKNNAAYKAILGGYASSKAYNFSLNYGDAKVLPGARATTYTSKTITTWSQAGKVTKKEMTGAKSDSYYGETPRTTTTETVENGKTMVVTYERSEIGMAKTLIHEAIHAKIGLTNKTDDADHNTFSTFRNSLLTALKEYNTNNKMGFTGEQLEMLSWEGVDKSAAFKTHLEDLAKKNGTTFEEEHNKWSTEVSKMGWKETKKEEKK